MSKDKKAVSQDILSPADDHAAIIAEFRQNLSEGLSCICFTYDVHPLITKKLCHFYL